MGTLFTHHQKCVIVDTPAGGNNRKVTAFIGGLDMCDGRYDTPEHRLFKDLNTVFKSDIHNPTLTVQPFSHPLIEISIEMKYHDGFVKNFPALLINHHKIPYLYFCKEAIT